MLLPGTFDEQELEMARSNKQQTSRTTENPKLDPDAPNKKEPDEWVSGDDPMIGAQASYLKTLSKEAGDPDAYDENLTKAEASKRIDALKQEWGWNRKFGRRLWLPSENSSALARTSDVRRNKQGQFKESDDVSRSPPQAPFSAPAPSSEHLRVV